QLLLPGETAAPGTATGKTGTPTAPTAGTAISSGITVNAVDANCNIVSSATPNVNITSSDSNAAIADDNGGTAGNLTLVAGTRTLSSFTFKTAGTRTITANDAAGTLTANTSPSITVSAGNFVKLQLLAPGETAAPGSAAGKAGTPTVQTAGTAFNVTVNAVDANWNLISTNDTVAITSSDANAILPTSAALSGGTKAFSVTLKTGGGATVAASDTTHTAIASNTSTAIPVNAAGFSKLQILAPGETAAPGTSTGKTGTPLAQTAGTAFNVTVNAVDANWNVVSTVIDTVGFTSTDGNASLPGNTPLSGGSGSSSVTLK